MRILFFAAAVILLLQGFCQGASFGETAQAGRYSVLLTFEEGRPAQGKNTAVIAVTDQSSRPVAGAHVKVDYLMPTLPGRKPMMAYSTEAKPAGDRYEATLDFAMKGFWNVVVSVTAGNETKEAKFSFEVE